MKSILLVDDDAMQLKLTRALLADAGFRVRTASGATEAITEARAEKPDAIVSDVLMRDGDGFRLCQQLRADPTFAAVPIVLVSAHFQAERDRSLATAVGANAYAERSPDFSRELAAVRSALGETAPVQASSDTGALYVERVTEQLTQLLDKARAADMRYRTLFDRANDGIAVLDENGIVVEVNRRMAELAGHGREELLGKHISAFTEPKYVELYQRQLAGGAVMQPEPAVALARPDGKTVYLQFSSSMLEVDGKKLVFSIGRDVTQDVESARRLAESEAKYRRLVENLVDVAWSSRVSDGQVLVMTPNVRELTGFTADEVTHGGAAFWSTRIHPEDVQKVSAARNAAKSDGAFDAQYRWQHKDGRWRWFRAHAHRSELDGVATFEGLISDITAHKVLEEEFRQAQKMEALGRLTGGVAHDFNNLLCVILANSDMVMRSLPEGDSRRDELASVREAGERAAGLTRQLLAFSRKQVLQPKLLDLGAVMQGVEKLLARVIGEDIRLTLAAERGLRVRADAGQLEQVLMNLAVNARDAMPQGGTLTLDARSVSLREAEVDGMPAGDYVRLSVSDSGCGMDAATQRHIFEPFFTTKPAGKGTGLGLSTCYGIVTQSGGHLGVSSTPGLGSTFTVHLPRVEGEEVAEVERPGVVARGGNETVLVVEDDEALRRTLLRMLSRLGYKVLAARDGDEALRLFDANRQAISLVLSDVVMPGHDGLETVERLRASEFRGKVLFMSGYIDRPELHERISKTQLPYIQKPFQRDALAKTVRAVIDGQLH